MSESKMKINYTALLHIRNDVNLKIQYRFTYMGEDHNHPKKSSNVLMKLKNVLNAGITAMLCVVHEVGSVLYTRRRTFCIKCLG